MSKYEVLSLLFSPSKNRYQYPGEVIELPNELDELAKILLRKRAIRPARVKLPRRKNYQTNQEVKELQDDTNN